MKGKDKICARSSWSIRLNIKNVQIGIPDRKEHFESLLALKLGSGHTLREVVVFEYELNLSEPHSQDLSIRQSEGKVLGTRLHFKCALQ